MPPLPADVAWIKHTLRCAEPPPLGPDRPEAATQGLIPSSSTVHARHYTPATNHLCEDA